MALFPHKPYIERLPTAIFPKYMSREKPKFAVIIPLFGSDYNTLSEPFSDTEFGLHCYSAVWAAMCLLRNSDFQHVWCANYFLCARKSFTRSNKDFQ